MTESINNAPTLYWKCGCGKLKLKVDGEPFSNAACHCHSCVASSRYIDEKYASKKDRVSGSAENGSYGAFVKPDQITVLSEQIPNIGVIKVGPNGKAVRKYVQCCGTLIGAVEKPFWCINGLCLYQDVDHTKKYEPSTSRQIVHCQKSNSFDPDKVPKEAYKLAPFSSIMSLLWVMINPFGPSTDPGTLEKFAVEDEKADIVPITW